MIYRKIDSLLFILLCAVLVLSSSVSLSKPNPAAVSDVRYHSGPRYTRVVVTLTSKAEFTHHLLKEDKSLKKPERLMIDVNGAKLSKEINKSFPVNDSLLSTVRVGQFDADTVRIVLDMVSVADYKVFVLPNPYRIVIDVMGTGYKYAPQSAPAVAPEAVKAAVEPAAKPPIKEDEKAPVKETVKETVKESPKVETKPSAPVATVIKTIVIDAGHGGKDPGAVGKKKTREKDITLKIAKYVKKDLQSKVKSNIVLTRGTDVFIPLDERTAIANAKEADLFVSIHVNASFNRSARGVETYYLKLDGLNKEELEIAARENATSAEEMSDTLKFILKDLVVTGNRDESIRLASIMQDTLSSDLKSKYKDIKSNGIKGAPFYVLVHTAMPSILVEVSYISNATDEGRLREDEYLRLISDSIAEAIIKYINGVKPS